LEGADFAYICEHKQLPAKKDDTIEAAAKHVAMFSGIPEQPALEESPAPAEESPEQSE